MQKIIANLKLDLFKSLQLNVDKLQVIIQLRVENLALLRGLKKAQAENAELKRALVKLYKGADKAKHTSGGFVPPTPDTPKDVKEVQSTYGHLLEIYS